MMPFLCVWSGGKPQYVDFLSKVVASRCEWDLYSESPLHSLGCTVGILNDRSGALQVGYCASKEFASAAARVYTNSDVLRYAPVTCPPPNNKVVSHNEYSMPVDGSPNAFRGKRRGRFTFFPATHFCDTGGQCQPY